MHLLLVNRVSIRETRLPASWRHQAEGWSSWRKEGSSQGGGCRSKGGKGQGIQGGKEREIQGCRGWSGCFQGAPGQSGSREVPARGSQREEQ